MHIHCRLLMSTNTDDVQNSQVPGNKMKNNNTVETVLKFNRKIIETEKGYK